MRDTQPPTISNPHPGKIECLVFSRVCGYYAQVRNWNQGKRQEWAERKAYEVPDGD